MSRTDSQTFKCERALLKSMPSGYNFLNRMHKVIRGYRDRTIVQFLVVAYILGEEMIVDCKLIIYIYISHTLS